MSRLAALRPLVIPALLTLVAAATLSACGSASSASGTTSAAAATASASTSPTGSPASAQHNAALQVALRADELGATTAGYTQTGDGLLASTPSTDARVFSSPDGTIKVEVDLAADTSSTAALADYTAYADAAKKQVVTPQSSTAPNIGVKAGESDGTDSSGHSVVAIAFVQGSVIGVVTMVSTTGTVDPAIAESIAQRQVAKIKSAGL